MGRQREILDVFFVDDERLRTAWWTKQQGWWPMTLQISQNRQVSAGVAVVNRGRDSMDAFFVGTDLNLYTVQWRNPG